MWGHLERTTHLVSDNFSRSSVGLAEKLLAKKNDRPSILPWITTRSAPKAPIAIVNKWV